MQEITLTCQPRHVLFLFNTFKKAFEFCDNVYREEIELMDDAEKGFEDEFEYATNQFKAVCQRHKKEIKERLYKVEDVL